jgi:osmotically-inducible protein OsmY
MKTDSQLQRDVIDELAWDPSVDHAHVGVAAKGGVVTLSGFIGDYAQKMAAQRAAERVQGVQAIAEELTVRFASDPKTSDAEIARRIVDLFAWDVTIPNDTTTITVEKGWVTLSGAVDWNYQKDAARKAAGRIAGVIGVSNQLVVNNAFLVDDVRGRIMAAFKRSATAEASALSVTAVGSTVTLGGTVSGRHERQVAERTAWAAPGVHFVEDKITVL